MTSIDNLFENSKFKETSFFTCISCVHFLNSGELEMRFLHFAPFVCRKCILKNFECLVLIIRVPNLKYIHVSPFRHVTGINMLNGNVQ